MALQTCNWGFYPYKWSYWPILVAGVWAHLVGYLWIPMIFARVTFRPAILQVGLGFKRAVVGLVMSMARIERTTRGSQRLLEKNSREN